jgi:NADH dehydrogenase/NADH:ubiquinone oxidoreductase subunit G
MFAGVTARVRCMSQHFELEHVESVCAVSYCCCLNRFDVFLGVRHRRSANAKRRETTTKVCVIFVIDAARFCAEAVNIWDLTVPSLR